MNKITYNDLKYLNENSLLKSSQVLKSIEESVFSFSIWFGDKKKVYEEVIKETKKLYKAEIKKAEDMLRKKYKYKFFKPVYEIKTPEEVEKMINFINEYCAEDDYLKFKEEHPDQNVVCADKRTVYRIMPFTLSIKVKKDKETVVSHFVFIETPTILKLLIRKMPVYNQLASIFSHPLELQAISEIINLHEASEAVEGTYLKFNQAKHNGMITITHANQMMVVGNHYTLSVLAKEAVTLNNYYDRAPALKKLRKLRVMFEWRVIKYYTGLDFSTIKKWDEALFKKIRNIKPQKIKELEKTLGKINNIPDSEKHNEVVNAELKDIFKVKLENP